MREFHLEKSVGLSVNDPLLTKLINLLMKKGKKAKAVKLVSDTLEELRKNPPKTKNLSSVSKPIDQFKEAVLAVKPVFQLKSVRIAGTNYQVPAILAKHRQESIAIKWILEGAKSKKKKNVGQAFHLILAQEIRDSFFKEAYACKKRDELNRLVESNRGVAHYRWW
jgi:small subunit ribosomal protein S7